MPPPDRPKRRTPGPEGDARAHARPKTKSIDRNSTAGLRQRVDVEVCPRMEAAAELLSAGESGRLPRDVAAIGALRLIDQAAAFLKVA